MFSANESFKCSFIQWFEGTAAESLSNLVAFLIYIYAFGIHFYPKQHAMSSLGIKPVTLALHATYCTVQLFKFLWFVLTSYERLHALLRLNRHCHIGYICFEMNCINVGLSFISFWAVAERPVQVQGMELFLIFGKHRVSALCYFMNLWIKTLVGQIRVSAV